MTLIIRREMLPDMRGVALVSHLTWLVLGCSGAEAEPDATPAPAPPSGPSDGMNETPVAASDEMAVEALSPTLVLFTDADTGFATADVYDATREVVRFDAERQAMVSSATGDAVSGWATNGTDLGPFGAFRVRFGSEGGQRRAYFTEAGNGTLCDLVLSGPEMLSIYATSERPPLD